MAIDGAQNFKERRIAGQAGGGTVAYFVNREGEESATARSG
jgi:hypothetical protein